MDTRKYGTVHVSDDGFPIFPGGSNARIHSAIGRLNSIVTNLMSLDNDRIALYDAVQEKITKAVHQEEQGVVRMGETYPLFQTTQVIHSNTEGLLEEVTNLLRELKKVGEEGYDFNFGKGASFRP